MRDTVDKVLLLMSAFACFHMSVSVEVFCDAYNLVQLLQSPHPKPKELHMILDLRRLQSKLGLSLRPRDWFDLELDVCHLYGLTQYFPEKPLTVQHIPGSENPADTFSKPVDVQSVLVRHVLCPLSFPAVQFLHRSSQLSSTPTLLSFDAAVQTDSVDEVCNTAIASSDVSDVPTGVLRDVTSVLPSVSSVSPPTFSPSIPTVTPVCSSLVSQPDSLSVPSSEFLRHTLSSPIPVSSSSSSSSHTITQPAQPPPPVLRLPSQRVRRPVQRLNL